MPGFTFSPVLAGGGASKGQEDSVTGPFCTTGTWEAALWDDLVVPSLATPESGVLTDVLSIWTFAALKVLGAKFRGTSLLFVEQPPSGRVALVLQSASLGLPGLQTAT